MNYKKYNDKYVKYSFKCNKEKEADIIAFLDSKTDKSKFIKRLILTYMEGKDNGKM